MSDEPGRNNCTEISLGNLDTLDEIPPLSQDQTDAVKYFHSQWNDFIVNPSASLFAQKKGSPMVLTQSTLY
jgi:hypothetical protein